MVRIKKLIQKDNLLWVFLFWIIAPFSLHANVITLATTTSTENSGLLNYLIPEFEKQHNIHIKVIATGTGKALKLAQTGDVDVVMVHAPEKEKQFISQGYGIHRSALMYNYFVIVGPKQDPASVSTATDAKTAFSQIAWQQSNFTSRGDFSGTHVKELDLWKQAGIEPNGSWYKQLGQGMGKTLQIADELKAYTLIDQGTWLKLKDKAELELLYYNDPLLLNPYSVILVNPDKHPHVNHSLSKIFLDWLTSDITKQKINQYKVSGQQLFFAN